TGVGHLHAQHGLGRRVSEPSRHQSGAVFDEQICRPSLPEALEHELEGTKVGVTVLCPGPINTNIARGARNRPDHMGGPQIPATHEAVLPERLARTWLDPKKVGERVVDAIQTFYAFVGAVPADVVRARHRRIEAALSSPWVTHY